MPGALGPELALIRAWRPCGLQQRTPSAERSLGGLERLEGRAERGLLLFAHKRLEPTGSALCGAKIVQVLSADLALRQAGGEGLAADVWVLAVARDGRHAI